MPPRTLERSDDRQQTWTRLPLLCIRQEFSGAPLETNHRLDVFRTRGVERDYTETIVNEHLVSAIDPARERCDRLTGSDSEDLLYRVSAAVRFDGVGVVLILFPVSPCRRIPHLRVEGRESFLDLRWVGGRDHRCGCRLRGARTWTQPRSAPAQSDEHAHPIWGERMNVQADARRILKERRRRRSRARRGTCIAC